MIRKVPLSLKFCEYIDQHLIIITYITINNPNGYFIINEIQNL